MDIGLHLKVIWRFRLLVAGGLVLAIALSILSVAKVSFVGGKPQLTYRKAETWQAETTVLITQRGFPWGRAVLPTAPPDTTPGKATTANTYADPSRLSSLASFYSQLANGDAVKRQLHLPKPDMVSAAPVVDKSTGYATALPLLQISALGTTPAASAALADRATSVFISYIRRQQADAGIPTDQRVVLQLVSSPQLPQLVVPRKKTLPIVAFVTVLIAVIGLAFILENLRPAVRLVPTQADELAEMSKQRTAARST